MVAYRNASQAYRCTHTQKVSFVGVDVIYDVPYYTHATEKNINVVSKI